MRLFRRKITNDTDLERVSTERLLEEHRRRVLATDDLGTPGTVGAVGLTSDIEDVLDRRGVSYPRPEEILAQEQARRGA
jgi:hypothetical protein